MIDDDILEALASAKDWRFTRGLVKELRGSATPRQVAYHLSCLEKRGLVERVRKPGPFGVGWRITDKGREERDDSD